MKRLLIATGCAVLLILAVVALSDQNEPAYASVNDPTGLPASLDQFYPPKSPGPVYLMEMHHLSRPLTGMITDLFEGDMENAQENYEAFKQQYAKMSEMIPEWSGMYSLPAVEKLGEALKSGQQDQIMAAVGQVGQTCEGCHHSHMPAVQHAYHWGDFNAISTEDPLSKSTVSFKQLMMMMETSMSGVGNELQQGQIENARKQLSAFEARFHAMSETCTACHDSKREYYVDEEITGYIAALQQQLAAEKIDAQAVGGLFQRIGQESCAKCHHVHIPAAYAEKTPLGL